MPSVRDLLSDFMDAVDSDKDYEEEVDSDEESEQEVEFDILPQDARNNSMKPSGCSISTNTKPLKSCGHEISANLKPPSKTSCRKFGQNPTNPICNDGFLRQDEGGVESNTQSTILPGGFSNGGTYTNPLKANLLPHTV